jgi:lipopolysaccharide export system protein LptA
MPKIRRLLLALGLLLPGALPALSTDREQPIEVEADRLEIREQENLSIYEGNVHLVQGSLEIRSERLVIHFNQANELTLMEMSGAPARFRQLDDNGEEMHGEGLRINYMESDALLELLDEARFRHGSDTIEGKRIRIDTETNSIQANGDESDERVKMLIRPRQNRPAAE